MEYVVYVFEGLFEHLLSTLITLLLCLAECVALAERVCLFFILSGYSNTYRALVACMAHGMSRYRTLVYLIGLYERLITRPSYGYIKEWRALKALQGLYGFLNSV